MTLRAAIVGTGAIAEAHVAALRAHSDRVEVVAATDLDAGRLAAFCERHGVDRGYPTAAKMLEREQPDLVHVCTPPATHAGLAIRALEAGAWVLCEKPLCGSLAELARIEEAERATRAWCCSVVQWRFGSAAQHLKRLAAAGVAGRPLLGLCETTWYRDADYYAVPWRGRWDTELGGATMGQGIHAIDLFLWIIGPWSEVTARVATLDHEIEVEDVSLATVRFASGAMGVVVNSVVSPHEETRLRFDFQRATFEVSCLYAYTNRDWTCMPAPHDAQVAQAWAAIEADVPNTHAAQVGALLDAYEARRRPPASAAELGETFDFITSLYKSAATRAPVARRSIQPGDPFYERVAGTLAR
jgi:predicted dehydrogenase